MILETDRVEFSSEDTLGGRMSYARELAEMEIGEAARRLGVMTSTWKAWECDRDTPRANRLFMMAGILGVTPIWLLAGRGPGPAENSLSQHSDSLTAQLTSALAEAAASQQRIQQIGEQLRIHAQKEYPRKRSSSSRGATEAEK
jgi:transcriptional regulator with XRE-family HTH domain